MTPRQAAYCAGASRSTFIDEYGVPGKRPLECVRPSSDTFAQPVSIGGMTPNLPVLMWRDDQENTSDFWRRVRQTIEQSVPLRLRHIGRVR